MRSPGRPGIFRSRLRRQALAAGAGVVILALAAAACSSSSSSGGSSTSSGGQPVTGGTAVYAEQPATPPNYIFPYIAGPYATTSNVFYLQALLYRPLYWFGDNGQPTMNPSLSLAKAPVFNGRNLTIMLNHYMWSNGTPVTAQNVVFWLHMQETLPEDYGAYSGFPANVSNIKAVSSTELTMTMDKPYSPTWFLYNDLSQVTPMPTAWDRTASGPSSCATTLSDCAKVYAYLNAQALNLNSYVGSPL
jgi:peptide/nickel transport system substrate-binding protein